jgi:hypothetical protein
MKRALLALIVLAATAIVPGTSSADSPGFGTIPCDYPAGKPLPGSGTVRNVPADHSTIQAAVNAAVEGDTILIAAGTYNEAVRVTTPGLRIRGASRNGTILDGQSTKKVGILVEADRVVVENMTLHHYTEHGVQWLKTTGFWGRFLTSYNHGAYGVFALGSRCGEFSDVYASGSADSGIYIGQCYPCDAVIHHIDAQENALGFSGTNAGGNLVLRDSVWKNNGLGIVPNSLDSEEEPPQRGIIIGPNNLVESNNNLTAPAFGIQSYFYGGGIVIAGGQSATVYGNTVKDNALAGILLSPIPDQNVYLATGNTIWGNTVTHDPVKYPDSNDLAQGASSGPNNCWHRNTFSTSAPLMIEDIWGCGPIVGTQVTPPGGDPRAEWSLVSGVATGEADSNLGTELSPRNPADWRTWPAPTCDAHPTACVEQTSDTTGAVDRWLPALGLD